MTYVGFVKRADGHSLLVVLHEDEVHAWKWAFEAIRSLASKGLLNAANDALASEPEEFVVVPNTGVPPGFQILARRKKGTRAQFRPPFIVWTGSRFAPISFSSLEAAVGAAHAWSEEQISETAARPRGPLGT